MHLSDEPFFCVHGMSEIALGVRTVFAKQKTRSYIFDVTPCLSGWTSLGLNQGPPDYELFP